MTQPYEHYDLVDVWTNSERCHLEPEEAIAILQEPAIMAAHDPKIQKLVKLLRLSSSPEFAGMLKREIRMRKLLAMIHPDSFLENNPTNDQLH